MFASLLLLATPGLAAATEADLAWLAGEWCGGGEGERIEERGTAPVANDAIGISPTVGSMPFIRP